MHSLTSFITRTLQVASVVLSLSLLSWGFTTINLVRIPSKKNTDCLFAKREETSNNKAGLFGGYKFGDISRSIGKKITGNDDYEFGDITKSIGKTVTGNEEYKFGDISRWLDSRAKEKVSEMTGKDDYEFGDLSRYLDEKAKSKVNEFTKKDEYVVGDISKEIIRRVSSGDYEFKDILLLCRVLASFGFATFSPVAAALPSKLLLELFNYSLEMDIAGRLLELLAEALDKRFKEALTGDANYQVGDLTRQRIMSFMGKGKDDKYEFGDFTKAVQRRTNQKEKSSDAGMVLDLDSEVAADLEKIDNTWKEQTK